MPARSKSQQRLFGMVHAYQKGKLKNAPEGVKNIAEHISEEDAEHFARTSHRKLPEKKAEMTYMNKIASIAIASLAYGLPGQEKKADMQGFMSKLALYSDEKEHNSPNKFLKRMGMLSTAAVPFALSALFHRRATPLVKKVEKILQSPTAKRISLQDAAKAAMGEKLRWDKAGYKFKNMSIAEQNTPIFADLSEFTFDPVGKTGQLRIGVKSLADAHKSGISSDMFFHELGHAHEAYNNIPKTAPGMIFNKVIGRYFVPGKWNPLYKEEVRAWNNARKLSGGNISREAMDAALNTYKNEVLRRNAVAWSGVGSAGLIGNHFFGQNDGTRR